MIHKPLRIEFDNDSDFFEAGIQYLQQVKEAALADIRQIDTADNRNKGRMLVFDKQHKNVFTIHDWLQKHPHLIERYKKIGAAALLEI